jgi:hypothetical protein
LALFVLGAFCPSSSTKVCEKHLFEEICSFEGLCAITENRAENLEGFISDDAKHWEGSKLQVLSVGGGRRCRGKNGGEMQLQPH